MSSTEKLLSEVEGWVRGYSAAQVMPLPMAEKVLGLVAMVEAALGHLDAEIKHSLDGWVAAQTRAELDRIAAGGEEG